ncbi:hypothetical protein BDP55DRAFT_683713 [Colletotrichum godetiae]|uniref:Uncharacterized protein n=1 Tax=Colletotrichum godetiae TaxID=1209918 RepID=A0AAJ0A8V8_9PEZI|nr:uncharacterized protein BDP55DRAFT_683713 [Colletotrichum godetiae]KAK1658058.1 hypothetical protein BDP55DRAFT_683713 [Colletotrichum godetiae]
MGVDDPTNIAGSMAIVDSWGTKRKQVYLWTCCGCGNTGMPISYSNCQTCDVARCAYCAVSKVRI